MLIINIQIENTKQQKETEYKRIKIDYATSLSDIILLKTKIQ